MPINVQDLIDILAEILEEQNLKVNLTNSFQGGLFTGILAMLGGIFLGPIGLAIGGAVGGSAAAVKFQNSFKSAAVIIKELPQDKKNRLCMRVRNAFRNFGIQDLMPLLREDVSLRDLAIREVSQFLNSEMGYSIQN